MVKLLSHKFFWTLLFAWLLWSGLNAAGMPAAHFDTMFQEIIHGVMVGIICAWAVTWPAKAAAEFFRHVIRH